MPKAKNLGPCVIPECNYENTCRFRKMTKLAIEKVKNKHPEGSYNFIEEGNELFNESESREGELDCSRIKINLVDAFYQQQRALQDKIELDPIKFSEND
ncbi:874_t:CDS:2 [Entrophospora sp. SA101]|nr:874_t:CDS:2 [Entrophospora sp. SA101]